MRRFRCQCCSCSCWLRQWPPSEGDCKRPPSMSMGMDPRSSSSGEGSFSCSVDKARQSSGLHSPKSESFMCPCLSNNKLSGLMSLVHSIMPVQPTKETDQKRLQTERRYISEVAEKSSQQQFGFTMTMSSVITLWELLIKCQTITFITNSSDKQPWLPTDFIRSWQWV
jgi:hypothetical protein